LQKAAVLAVVRAAKVPDPEGGHYVTKEWTNWMVSGKPEVGYKES